MAIETDIRKIYTKIEEQLFYMIPEKWEAIYLYASIIEKGENENTGEMFFYYYPKGILRKNPINVYEIPSKFNIDEESFMKLVEELYKEVQELRNECKKEESPVWSNITISIVDYKFKVEYNYDDLQTSMYNSEDRRKIWQYKYLNYPIEKFKKEDRETILDYLETRHGEKQNNKVYTEGMYKLPKKKNITKYERNYNIKTDIQENKSQILEYNKTKNES